MTDEEWALIRQQAERLYHDVLFGATPHPQAGWVTMPASQVLNMCNERDRLCDMTRPAPIDLDVTIGMIDGDTTERLLDALGDLPEGDYALQAVPIPKTEGGGV